MIGAIAVTGARERKLAWFAFTKKAQIRNVALLEFKHLTKVLQDTSGVPPGFFNDPYVVGFLSGYTMGVGFHVGGKGVKASDVTSALTEVLFQLVPNDARSVAQRYREWEAAHEPAFDAGQESGTLLALYAYKAARLDNDPIVLEARVKAERMAPIWDKLHQNPDDHSRMMSALRQMLFWDKIEHLK